MKISKEKHEKLMHTAQEKLFTHASKEDKKQQQKQKHQILICNLALRIKHTIYTCNEKKYVYNIALCVK